MFQLSENDRPHRGRRITWEEFTELTGRERPVYTAANENNAFRTSTGLAPYIDQQSSCATPLLVRYLASVGIRSASYQVRI